MTTRLILRISPRDRRVLEQIADGTFEYPKAYARSDYDIWRWDRTGRVSIVAGRTLLFTDFGSRELATSARMTAALFNEDTRRGWANIICRTVAVLDRPKQGHTIDWANSQYADRRLLAAAFAAVRASRMVKQGAPAP